MMVSVFPVYYRALVNFTDSLVYSPELEDIYSVAFNEVSEAVVDTVSLALMGPALPGYHLRHQAYLNENKSGSCLFLSYCVMCPPPQLQSEYNRIPGSQTINVVLIK